MSSFEDLRRQVQGLIPSSPSPSQKIQAESVNVDRSQVSHRSLTSKQKVESERCLHRLLDQLFEADSNVNKQG